MKQKFLQVMGLGLGIAILGSVGRLELKAMAETEPAWYNCLTREVFTPEKKIWCDRWKTLQNATLIVPINLGSNPKYTTITLNNGRYQQKDGSLIIELVNQKGWMAFGDINNDGKTDATAIFGAALDPNGKSIATYLTAVLDIDGKAEATTPVKLGERIILGNTLTVNNNRITVPLLTAKEVIYRTYILDGNDLVARTHQSASESVLANLRNGTLIFSQTSSYAVRVFTQNGMPRLNLFNQQSRNTELTTVSALVESSLEGITYRNFSQANKPPLRVKVATSGIQTIEVNNRTLQDYAQITGMITTRSRTALPANAVFDIKLVDVSRADVKATVLASQSLVSGDRQMPIPFALVYNPSQIDSRLRYAVQARVTVEGELRFINTTQIPVITQGNSTEVEVIVDPVSR
jgi:uncharacterized lipoprotein YbaY